MRLDLSINDQQRTGLKSFLNQHLSDAHAMLKASLTELSVALVDSRTSARLHREFMGLPGPTDVLTFELQHSGRRIVTSGEIVVCVPYARRAARAAEVPLKHELLLYCLHGMLHLCGYDDRTQRGFNQMHRKEDDILERLGIGPVFAAGSAELGALGHNMVKGTIR